MNNLPHLIPVIACHICLSKNEKVSVIIFYRNEASAAVAKSNKIEVLFLYMFLASHPTLSLQVAGIRTMKLTEMKSK